MSIVICGIFVLAVATSVPLRAQSSPPVSPTVTVTAAAGATVNAEVNARNDAPVLATALLAVTLNDAPQRNAITALTDARYQVLYLAERGLATLRIAVPPNAVSRTEDNERFIAASSLPGVTFRVDATEQRLFLTVSANAFIANSVALSLSADPTATRSGYTGYFAYDLNAERSDAQRSLGGITEIGVTSPHGVFTSSHVFNRLFSGTASTTTDTSTAAMTSRRLDTTYTLDRPAQAQTIRLGDFVSRSAIWTQPARIGGIQISTNFNTRPEFITYPLRDVSGQAALPSVVDVFVNNLFAGRQDVAAGPFQVTNVPIVNGQGEVRVVVRDVLGREQVFTSSFYASSQLLKPGLDDYAFSVGRARQQYGLQSTDYGRLQSSGYWRRGLTDRFTLLTNIEAARGFTSVGAGATVVLPALGELSASVARSQITGTPATNESLACCTSLMSDFEAGVPANGNFTSLSIDRRFPRWSIGGQLRVASRGFRTLTDLDSIATRLASTLPRRELIVSAGFGGTRSGSWSLNYVSQTHNRVDTQDNTVVTVDTPVYQNRVDSLSLGYSLSLGKRGFLSLAAVTTLPGSSNNVRNRNVQLTYVLPLGPNHAVTAAHTFDDQTTGNVEDGTSRRNLRHENRLTLQRALPTGEGLGYRLEVSDDKLYRSEARLATSFATLGLDWSEANDSRGWRASANGTFTAIGGGLYAGRRVADAFALVDAGGFPNVRIYADNQLQGRTDASGRLFLANLRPFQRNIIAIEPNDLPLDTEIVRMQLEAIPAFKSGIVVNFPIRRTRGALLRLIDEHGLPIPSGALVSLITSGAFITENEATFPVADDGMVFITDLQQTNKLRVSYRDLQCEVIVNLPKTRSIDDPQPNLGNFTCLLKK